MANMTEKKERYFMINEDVNEGNVGTIIREIEEINAYDDKMEKKKVGYKRKPIKLVVSTFGGSAYDGIGLASVIRLSKTPIHGYCYTKAMSAGFLIYAVCHKRFASETAALMYHEVRGWAGGELQNIKATVEEWQRLQNFYDGYVLDRSNISRKKLEKVKEKKQDWFISAAEGVELGLVDKLLK